jgi:uncharacterized protein (DUF4415 family)
MNDTIARKGRGKGKKPALSQVTLRLDADVYEYFKTNYPTKFQATIRDVLRAYITEGAVK